MLVEERGERVYNVTRRPVYIPGIYIYIPGCLGIQIKYSVLFTLVSASECTLCTLIIM